MGSGSRTVRIPLASILAGDGTAAGPPPTSRCVDERVARGPTTRAFLSAIGLAVLVGIWLDIWAAAAVTVGFAVIVISALTVWFTRRAHPRAADAPHVAPPVADERYRILVVADTHGVASDLAEALRSHARGQPASVFVIAPALESRLGRLTSDQNGYDDAARRLMILFVTHRERQTNWLEEGVVELAESRYHQPIEHIAVP